MLFKTIPRVNTLYHDKGPCTTQHIDYILSQHKRVLLIVDETSKHDYNIPSVQKLTIYKIISENCLEERAVINFKKFIILVKQGYIGMNSYDLFIFRLNGMSKELMECFKIFYLYNPSKKLVICYFNIIEKLDYIYMACEYDTQFKNVYNIFVDPVDDIEATNYFKLKSMIFESKSICPGVKNKITELENITYKYALLYIRKKFNLEIDSNANIQTDPKLAINNYKFENTLQTIKENNNLHIYIKCINKNVIKFLKLQTENDVQEYVKGINNLENSILIIYDSFEDFGYEMNFQKIYIYHEDKCKANLYSLFRNFSIDENNVNYLSQKYHKEELKYTMIGSTGAFYDYTSSYTLLMHFFYLLQQMLKDEYFYLKCSNLCCDYLESLGKFQCKITFPFLHEQFEPISGTFQPNKIEARKCTAYKSLEFLIKNGFINDHLCPIKERFINKNKIYYRHIFETYKLDAIADNLSLHSTHTGKGLRTNLDGYNHDALIAQIESIKQEYINNIAKTSEFTPSRISVMFERDHRIDLGFDQVVEKYDFAFDVKLPKALSSYSKTYNIYRCKHLLPDTDAIDCKLGLCTSQSFTETLIFHDSEISYVGTHEFDNTEFECLLFFQTILFLLNFKKIKLVSTPAKEYCYFLVPIKNGRIDFDYLKTLSISKFLIQNVAQLEDKSLLKENFLYNPYNKKFYIYDKPCKGLITDPALFDKNTRYIDYYESKYNVKLKNRTGNDLLFIGYLFSGVPSSQSNILSTEILYVTNLKVSFCKDFNLTKKFFFAFEKMASAYELKQNMNVKITTQNMLKCLTPKDQDFDNYERLEFLGDTVLKFVCSGHLFNYTLGDCVTRKDKLISNESLFEIAKKHGIINYFSFIKYSEVMFQPPNILKFMDDEALGMQFAKCVDYFKAKDIFLSKNVTFQESKVKTIDDKVKGLKTYADIIEAMIGAHFIEFGLRESNYFIEALGITKKDDKGSNSDEYNEQIANKNEVRDKQSRLSNNERKQIELDSRTQEKATLENGLTGSLEFIKDGYKKMCIINEMKEYKNILKVNEIAGIERILNYKFNYPGLIEKAMIHPSSHNNVLGSINFNKLELLGDCALDLVVTEKIYHELVDLDPEGMHCKRKSLVNNFSLARVLFKMKLDVYLHICFDDKHKDNVARKLRTDGETVNKAFGDVLESICGAILLDMDFSYLRFKDYVINNLYNELENCSDATR